MENFWTKLSLVAKDKDLRRRILFVIFILAVFSIASNIPIPGVDTNRLKQFFSDSQLFSMMNIFSGGGLSSLSIMMLGVGPYITASIILQLLTMIFPSLKEMYQEEGQAGKRKFSQYSRVLSVPLAALQAVAFMALLKKNGVLAVDLPVIQQVVGIFVVTGGSVLLMWLGELISEYGIGNGVSMIIFAGIVGRIPTALSRLRLTFTPEMIPTYIAFAAVAVIIIAGTVIISEAERPIPVTYAKRIRGTKVYGGTSTYLPLRLNQAGVIPIIFALSILLFPQMIVTFLGSVGNSTIQAIASGLGAFINNTIVYGLFYFILVVLFTYFYTAVTFDPNMIADNLQKGGAFIPGVRPGRPTSEYVGKVITRLTLFGAVFLGFIAILPFIMQGVTGDKSLAIGGTALLIVVSVVLELAKLVDAQISMREY